MKINISKRVSPNENSSDNFSLDRLMMSSSKSCANEGNACLDQNSDVEQEAVFVPESISTHEAISAPSMQSGTNHEVPSSSSSSSSCSQGSCCCEASASSNSEMPSCCKSPASSNSEMPSCCKAPVYCEEPIPAAFEPNQSGFESPFAFHESSSNINTSHHQKYSHSPNSVSWEEVEKYMREMSDMQDEDLSDLATSSGAEIADISSQVISTHQELMNEIKSSRPEYLHGEDIQVNKESSSREG